MLPPRGMPQLLERVGAGPGRGDLSFQERRVGSSLKIPGLLILTQAPMRRPCQAPANLSGPGNCWLPGLGSVHYLLSEPLSVAVCSGDPLESLLRSGGTGCWPSITGQGARPTPIARSILVCGAWLCLGFGLVFALGGWREQCQPCTHSMLCSGASEREWVGGSSPGSWEYGDWSRQWPWAHGCLTGTAPKAL